MAGEDAGFTHGPGGSLTEDRAGRSLIEAIGTGGMIEGLAACFAGLADPRETRRCDHRLVDIWPSRSAR